MNATSSLNLGRNIIVHDHPLIRHKISMMRSKECETGNFRDLTREIGSFLGFQASAGFHLTAMPIPLRVSGTTENLPVIEGRKTVVVPILRAGLVVGEGVLQAMPAAHVGHLGFRRRPDDYGVDLHLVVLPDPRERDFLLCDASVGTGNTACKAIETLLAVDVPQSRIQFLTVLIAPEGARQIADRFPDVVVHAAACEDGLDNHKHVVPGFGDMDDRLFGIR